MNSTVTSNSQRPRRWLHGVVRDLLPYSIHIVAATLIIGGFGMMGLARYKIRTICQKYPIEIQMRDFPQCVKYGGPWPQKTNAPAKP